MKRVLALGVLLASLCLTGCAGDTVIYQVDCDHEAPPQTDPTPQPPADGAVKTGLYLTTDLTGSTNAEKADFDAAIVAVTVDEEGVIRRCVIDGVSSARTFDTTGTVTGDITAPVRSKNELGEDYGMKAYGGARYEWDVQAAALAAYCVGKRADTLRDGIDDAGYAADENLAATASIYLGGLVSAVELAATQAVDLGASAEDELRLSVLADHSGSTSATEGEPGRVRLNCTAAAVTFSGAVITSCRIDSVQADVTFDAMGTITHALPRHVKTKNELGEAYGMKAYGGAQWEWYQQAAAFGDYVRGRTVAQVLEIPVSDGKPAQADLAASVTISVTPFQQLLARAGGYGER